MAAPLASVLALAALAWVLTLPGLPPAVSAHAATVLGAAMLLLPLVSPRSEGRPPDPGLPLPPPLGSLATGLVATLVLLVPAEFLARAGWLPLPAPGFRLAPGELPWFGLVHMVAVVLPEEVFFRGFLRPRLEGARPDVRRLVAANVAQALAFGLVHVAARQGDLRAFDRALPGLAFGALAQRTGDVWGAAVCHLAANLWLFTR